ncbi:FtsX-like permease family protein [Micromonospora mirobrigensis]|uniref:Putative ABC transport system permease protein n=1 Tax=Micromonospora mirobrigensis TaxID=262898 RepID=A0A1C5A1W3_9ACTN|nr:FtsX-like permease family protein [Micromonospora mirobrigensis]SCF39004.1 putative ABC transport system permease protein [Micromonospora mirobrigensis]
MGPFGVVRRVRAFGGYFLLLGVLALVTAFLASGVPRMTNRLGQEGLDGYLTAQPAAQRDLTFRGNQITAADGVSMTDLRRENLELLPRQLPRPVRDALGQRWYEADTAPVEAEGPDLAARNLKVELTVRSTPGVQGTADLAGGRWPGRSAGREAPVELALATDTAAKLNLRVGSRLRLSRIGPAADPEPVTAVVVGLFTPRDRGDGIWDGLPQTLRVDEPGGESGPFGLVGLTDASHLDRLVARGWSGRFSWRYRLDPERVDVRRLDQVVDGIRRTQRTPPHGTELTQGVDELLSRFDATIDAARTLLAVIAAGVLATLAGLVALAAALAVRRRRGEFALIRARGGGVTSGPGRSLAEALLVVPPAAVAGWLLGTLVPGAPGSSLPLTVTAAVVITVALPVATLAVAGPDGRRDLVRMRPGARRLTVEVFLLGLAALAAVLLRRRGLVPGTVDPLLVTVPVLLAVAAAVLALRLYPWPLLLASRIATRTRGTVAFLGTARAGRSGVGVPLVVVVLAIATAAFCGVLASGVETGRDRAVSQVVPADALIAGARLAPDTGAALQRSPGVRATTPLILNSAQRLATDEVGTDARLGDVTVLVLDGSGFAEVARRSGVDVAVPDALRRPAPGAGPVPAVVSPLLAGELAEAGLDSAFVPVEGRRHPFRVAATVGDFPLTDTGRYVVLPWSALATDDPEAPVPTGFLVAGDDLDAGELTRIGNEGQRRYQFGSPVVGKEPPRDVTVRTWAAEREVLGRNGANALLAFAFAAGAVGGTLFGLIAIAFTVLAGARSRGQVLSRLRTLGLSRGQGRGLLLVELVPLVAVAVLTGAVTGALLPLLLTPLLGLSAFTGGVPVRAAFEPGLVAGAVLLAAVALAFAVAVEAVNNRRLRLGEALRLGEESAE